MRAEAAPLRVSLAQAAPIPLAVELTCRPGELLALVGPSGSGKTTVLRAIAGLYRPSVGRIVSGERVWLDTASGIAVAPQARTVGLVFQDYALFPHLSALDNVRLAMQHLAEPERSAHAKALLARVHLDGLEARTPDQLSGGQRQRVALARALARDPRVLLLDEPFSAVDRMTRERLKEELASLRRSLEIPIILVTHDLEEAQALADRIAVLHEGTTLQTGAPDDVRLCPANPLVARLMGQTNIFDGDVEQTSDGSSEGRIRWRDRELVVGTTGEFRKGDRVAWLIPSDYVVVEEGGVASGPAKENTLPGILTDVMGLGEMTALSIRMGDAQSDVLRVRVTAREACALALKPGSRVTLRLLADGIHLMPPSSSAL